MQWWQRTHTRCVLVYCPCCNSLRLSGTGERSVRFDVAVCVSLSLSVCCNLLEQVVVAATPGALLTPWAKDIKALLVNFMPGQEGGNAIADVIFGDVNPSGKLPLTFPNIDNVRRPLFAASKASALSSTNQQHLFCNSSVS